VTRDLLPRRLRLLGATMGTFALVAACSASASPSPTGGGGATAAPSGGAPTTAAECEGGYPSGDIRFVIPYSAGGGFDTWARLVAPYLQEHLPNNPNVLVENKSGAGGLVGVTEVYGSKADGYTIAITEPGVLVTSQIAGTTEIDPAQLSGIGRVAVSPEVIVVAGNSEWDSIEAVQEAAKSAPVKMAHGGVAAINVVAFDALGIPWEGVFHEGSSESILSVVRGDSQIAIFPLTSMLESIKAGDVKPLTLVGTKPTGDQPGAAEVADVPTLDEVTGQDGLGGALEQHRIVVAPPGTPECVVGILSDALGASLADPDLAAQADEAGLLPVPADAGETQAIIDNTASTLNGYAELIKEKVIEE
jgi:tripartite-type tricarboxylate transporter receptor subunit TctC